MQSVFWTQTFLNLQIQSTTESVGNSSCSRKKIHYRTIFTIKNLSSLIIVADKQKTLSAFPSSLANAWNLKENAKVVDDQPGF